jgi:hypothetical protein
MRWTAIEANCRRCVFTLDKIGKTGGSIDNVSIRKLGQRGIDEAFVAEKGRSPASDRPFRPS